MGITSESEVHDQAEAVLWAAPAGPLPEPPVETNLQVLPLSQLTWPDAEKLFLRLLQTVRPVTYAKLFGTPGQGQQGIDAYARLPLDLTAADATGRDYITLQSRRVQALTAAKIKKAVDDFLKGDWSDKTRIFYYATSYDLQDTKLDEELRTQGDRLAGLGVTFVPWGVQEVSALLKDHPRIVDDFFGRSWVEAFCGPEAARALANNLPALESRELRTRLRQLYQAVFSAQGGIQQTEDPASEQQFVIVNVDPRPQQRGVVDVEQPNTESSIRSEHPEDGFTYVASRLGARRQSFRSAQQLIAAATADGPSTQGAMPADEWLAAGKYRLVIGGPGVGKSSLLRFAAADLLAERPQSITLQREHGGDLPVWLPFGFLCRHLDASTENSLVSAVEAWLSSQSAADLWPLAQRALHDDRLMLFVDGIDEWSDVSSAEHALGVLEAFLGRSNAAAVLSTRPYAVDRLNWQRPWAHAQITPLTDGQRRSIAAGILQGGTASAVDPEPRLHWGAGVEAFLAQLEISADLAQLSRSPLFLTLLATTWQGEPLPRQRFKIYTRLVELLIEKHPQMRQRASHARGGPLPAADASTLFAAVAYRLRLKDAAGVATKQDMRKLIVESMIDDEVLGYQPAEARRLADAVLAMAEEEFGLIVSHGAGSYGFLHRVVLDHLAGQHLAMLAPDEQLDAVRRFVHDPAWRDVLLALLSAQVSPHTTEPLLAAALNVGDHVWADLDGYELLADALAAGVRLTPRVQAAHTKDLVERVENHPYARHRANLITALVATLASPTASSQLLPIMKRWLTAPRPDPSATMWALRDLPIADEEAAKHLLWGLRHPSDEVKINAAGALARRLSGQPHLVPPLVALTETGPSSSTQAAAIHALGEGWPDAPDTERLIDWGRHQPSTALRLVALNLVFKAAEPRDSSAFRTEERDWLLSMLYHEAYSSGPWPAADLVAACAAGNTEAADFALETLKTNGRTGGDRGLAWHLACTVFADDARFKGWVAEQLASEDKHSLILYNLGAIPKQWRDDPVFAQALRPRVQDDLAKLASFGSAGLATALPPEQATAVLLRGLDGLRPYGAARVLADKYGDDETVREALTGRLRGSYKQAAPLAGVAVDVLGPEEGFAVLVSLLRQSAEDGRREERVVVAEAVAEAWIRLTAAEDEPGSGAAPPTLADYDPAELATLCTAGGAHSLTWHVNAVINAWPSQPAVQDFAEQLIADIRTLTSGIPDTIPVAILRSYCTRDDARSWDLCAKVWAQLGHVEPELREVLTFELTRSALTLDELVEVLSEWEKEPDSEVRRIAFIGLVQAIKRHQKAHDQTAGTDVITDHMQWLVQKIKDNLCAYGPDLDDLRQLAWTGVLMLGDITLIDGITEWIGESRPVAVTLTKLPEGAIDQILVDLIAEHWDRLREYFGDDLYQRLDRSSGDRTRSVADSRHDVMAALATTAARFPVIAEILRHEADTDPKLREDPHFLLWAKQENRGDETVLRALAGKLGATRHSWANQVLEAVLDRDSWAVPDDTFKAVLTDDAHTDPSGARWYNRAKLAAYVELFPNDAVSGTAFRNLEAWFRDDEAHRAPREWDDTLAMALALAPSQDLPVIFLRVHERFRHSRMTHLLPTLLNPLMRRLRRDAIAVDAFKTAVREPMGIAQQTPLFEIEADPIAQQWPDIVPAQRAYLFALALRQAGALPHHEAAAVVQTLTSISPDIVVDNPFTEWEGPLRLAVLDLLHG
ncbi:NACHT domain-containing protein [Dactylosporangium sp. CA-139066]|uniref:NACHT domain-containing protein n=1 Tax=Dactylosporangium sp. CA-139066 TaxID=3239930 RepID=UPI003D8A193B